ncbi:MAG: DUF1579 family protein, partial [Planctomycetota bacterium]
MSRAGLAAVAASAVVIGAGAMTAAMQPGDENMGEMILGMMREMGKPAPEHEWMHKLEGDWDFEAKFWLMPGMPPEVSTGTMSRELMLNGLGLRDEMQMDFAVMGEKIPVQGMGWMTYNKATQEYEMAWMDSLESYVTLLKGIRNDDGELVLEGEVQSLQGDMEMRQVFTWVDEDSTKLTLFGKNAMMPEWTKKGEITSKRKK